MKKMENFTDCLNEIIYRYKNDESVRRSLEKFNQTLMISCVKEDHNFIIKILNDQDIEIEDNMEMNDVPIIIHLMEEQILIDLLNKELRPLVAYSSGKIKIIKGDKRLLVKLRKLLF